ncbi:cell division protein SepF [Candidatus Woesearchaeota archaeon]|nr:cell division protein SepF [Candidatus Woesearchaeota archaeon]
MGFFSKLKSRFATSETASGASGEEREEGYVELGTDSDTEGKSKVTVRPFVIETFEQIKPILDSLREGHTIALINIRPLKDKDLVELKRAINKLKKTCDAVEGDIAGFGEDWIAAVPSFAHIYRTKETKEKVKPAEDVSEVTEYGSEEMQ